MPSPASALLFLYVRSAYNRLRRQIARARSPRYLLAVLLGAWVGGETLSASMLVSLALITLAVVLIVTKPKPVDPKPVASALSLSP